MQSCPIVRKVLRSEKRDPNDIDKLAAIEHVQKVHFVIMLILLQRSFCLAPRMSIITRLQFNLIETSALPLSQSASLFE